MSNTKAKARIPAKNRADEIDKIFMFGVFLLFGVVVGSIIIPLVLLNMTMEQSMVACFLNNEDLTLMIASELYAERLTTVLSYNMIVDNALIVVVGWLYGSLVLDYLVWLISKFILIPKGIIKANLTDLKKPLLTNMKSMIRYCVISVMLIGAAYLVTYASELALDVYQSRHTLIRDHVLPNLTDSGLAQEDKERLNQCAFNTNVTVITGKSYVEKLETK